MLQATAYSRGIVVKNGPGRWQEIPFAEAQSEAVLSVTGNDMQVDVEYFLHGGFTIGEEKVNTFAAEGAFTDGGIYLHTYLEQVTTGMRIEVAEVGGVYAWDDENMAGVDWLDIHKCDTKVVFMYEADGEGAFQDLAEDAVVRMFFHSWLNFFRVMMAFDGDRI